MRKSQKDWLNIKLIPTFKSSNTIFYLISAGYSLLNGSSEKIKHVAYNFRCKESEEEEEDEEDDDDDDVGDDDRNEGEQKGEVEKEEKQD